MIVPCILFVDRPAAMYFYEHRALRPLFQAAAVTSLLALPFAARFIFEQQVA
jgi:hypothetical protein